MAGGKPTDAVEAQTPTRSTPAEPPTPGKGAVGEEPTVRVSSAPAEGSSTTNRRPAPVEESAGRSGQSTGGDDLLGASGSSPSAPGGNSANSARPARSPGRHDGSTERNQTAPQRGVDGK